MSELLARLPLRGPEVRELGLPLPTPGAPAVGRDAPRMPPLRAGRPLKRWRYVAAFGPDLMLCAGDARIGPLPQRWWALARPGRPLLGATSPGSAGLALSATGPAGGIRLTIAARDAEVELVVPGEAERTPGGARSEAGGAGIAAPEAIEVVSRSGRAGWIWTRKRVGIPVRARVRAAGLDTAVDLEAMVDDSAGYHERHTAWRWTTGVGRAESGERVGWNLVAGVHDAPAAGEGTVWVDGRASEAGPASISTDLSGAALDGSGELRFQPWAVREHATNLLLVRSRYRQPFGRFAGELRDGLRLADGYGVMEQHDVHW